MPTTPTSAEGPETKNSGARPPGAPRLPHEHDEHADTAQPPRKLIERAEADIAEGQVDTDLRGQAREAFDNARPPRR